ncbi:DUF2235 domain-containing protein [Motiliproteus sp. MSK22-1]|uniref:phospholipase effector Tle1 domain-containing protein n=1 Tax=Motiliproteus sp. MSK22-1 TaxID=1897630 RepID=UPI000975A8D3|nr:DUF2235 domain-containing protein [Motiliproteus sp. MSK22-1]OMH38011.1 hypothetical protein BGP75_06925 [Motiliproteus sp. MSK22-1]
MANLIFCFDGTCNEPEDAREERAAFGFGSLKDNNITNVLKLHLLLGGNLRPEPSTDQTQRSYYYSGVGTYGSRMQKLRNILFAPDNEDVGAIIKRGIKDLVREYKAGDEVYVFGFSRGAAIARCFAARIPTIWPAVAEGAPPKIKFMGVFDTVASVNKPNVFKEENKPGSDVVFENHTLAPCVEKALHIVALDERRIAFMPTLINKDDRVTEIWFPGAHADVGGGYRYDGLSDQTLEFMLEFIQDSNYPLIIADPRTIDYPKLSTDPEILIEFEDVIIQPNPLGKSHEQEARLFIKEKALTHRNLRVLVNGVTSVHRPVLHHSVLDRLYYDPLYNPEPLLQESLINPYSNQPIRFDIQHSDGSIQPPPAPSLKQLRKQPRRPLTKLQTGVPATVKVYANQLYNASGIMLEKGKSYRFSIVDGQHWFDSDIDCGPEGWNSANEISGFVKRSLIAFYENDKRVPEGKWFELCGTINCSDDHAFRILNYLADDSVYKPAVSGELCSFANDLVDFYGNNMGLIKYSVTLV